jgi:hypothetical protein
VRQFRLGPGDMSGVRWGRRKVLLGQLWVRQQPRLH